MATSSTILMILQILLTAEPALVDAVHNLLSGRGTADDLALLKSDAIAWQAIADKAQAEIDKLKAPPVK